MKIEINKNMIFILFLIYVIFLNQYVIRKLGKILEKSSYSFILKLGEKIHKNSEYHISKLKKIPLELKFSTISDLNCERC